MLLTNGRIYTQARPVVDTLVVREGRVAFAGRRADVNPAAGERTIDLGGRAVLPGLVDGAPGCSTPGRGFAAASAGEVRKGGGAPPPRSSQ